MCCRDIAGPYSISISRNVVVFLLVLGLCGSGDQLAKSCEHVSSALSIIKQSYRLLVCGISTVIGAHHAPGKLLWSRLCTQVGLVSTTHSTSCLQSASRCSSWQTAFMPVALVWWLCSMSRQWMSFRPSVASYGTYRGATGRTGCRLIPQRLPSALPSSGSIQMSAKHGHGRSVRRLKERYLPFSVFLLPLAPLCCATRAIAVLHSWTQDYTTCELDAKLHT